VCEKDKNKKSKKSISDRKTVKDTDKIKQLKKKLKKQKNDD